MIEYVTIRRLMN